MPAMGGDPRLPEGDRCACHRGSHDQHREAGVSLDCRRCRGRADRPRRRHPRLTKD